MKECLKMFFSFFKIGLFTFGGGLAMLPVMQRIAVTEKGWLTDDEMVDCIAVAQSMPGVIAINAATYIGNKRKGFVGALAATCGVIMPSLIIIILAVLCLQAIGENRYVNGAFAGIKAAASGLILFSAIKLGGQAIKNKLAIFLAIASFVAIVIFDITAIWAIIVGAIVGSIYNTLQARAKDKEVKR